VGVKALDKHTLEIKTQDPIPFMAELVANTQLGPAHKATIEKWGKDWVKPGNMVGNGAYVLKEWKVNNRIVVEKNPHYWDAGNARLTKVTYLPIEDQFADIKLWESGETDYVYQMPPGVFDKYKAQYPKELRNQAIIGVRYYDYQTKDPAFKDVRVRKALSMVIDRDILSKRVTADGQPPAYSMMVAGTVDGADPPLRLGQLAHGQAVAEAKKLLEQAGVKPAPSYSSRTTPANTTRRWPCLPPLSGRPSSASWTWKLETMEFKVLIKKRHDGEPSRLPATAGWPTTTMPPHSCPGALRFRPEHQLPATARPKNSSTRATSLPTRPSARTC
jgi:oligopeptide transport system substrate-binding protein